MKKLTNTMKNSNNILLIISLFVLTSIFNACKPEPEEPDTPANVSITTNPVTDITNNSAKCGGSVSATGYSIGTCGLCYSKQPNPTIDSYITSDMVGTGSFTSIMSGLEKETKYYVRAYATTSSGVLYGEQKEFTTDRYEHVDLGLPSGLKWAACNIGASSPEDYGNYYAWGETTTKSEYTQYNCNIYGLSKTELQSKGFIDGSGNLTSSHDAASANWCGSWRIPTTTEIKELVNNCTWTWTIQGGTYGYRITGSNGNSIFLPAAGYRWGSELDETGEYGGYWSSSVYADIDGCARVLRFINNEYNYTYYSTSYHYGRTIRPVSD